MTENKVVVVNGREIAINKKYKWACMDRDGCWWAYVSKPIYHQTTGKWHHDKSDLIWIGFINEVEDCTKSLVKI